MLQHLIEATDASDAVVVALRIDDLAVADDIVDDDHAAWARELQRPGEIVRYVLLVGVNENEIEGSGPLGGELRQCVKRLAESQVDHLGQTGTIEIGACHLGVARFRLKRHDAATLRQSACQPDGAVAAKRADLQNSAGIDRPGEQHQQFALIGRHRDLRQARIGARFQRRIKHLVGGHEHLAHILVDGGPSLLGHRASLGKAGIRASFDQKMSIRQSSHSWSQR